MTSPTNPGLATARARCDRSSTRLAQESGHLTPAHMMAALRDHGATPAANWHPQDTVGATVCMHAADGARRGQSVAALVSDLRPGATVHWVTASSATCTGVFKPVLLEDGLPDQGPLPGALFDPDTRWWQHEALHRALLGDYAAAMPEFTAERDALEERFAGAVAAVHDQSAATRRTAVAACWAEADRFETDWPARLRGRAALRPAYRAAWRRADRLAGTALFCAPASSPPALPLAAE